MWGKIGSLVLVILLAPAVFAEDLYFNLTICSKSGDCWTSDAYNVTMQMATVSPTPPPAPEPSQPSSGGSSGGGGGPLARLLLPSEPEQNQEIAQDRTNEDKQVSIETVLQGDPLIIDVELPSIVDTITTSPSTKDQESVQTIITPLEREQETPGDIIFEAITINPVYEEHFFDNYTLTFSLTLEELEQSDIIQKDVYVVQKDQIWRKIPTKIIAKNTTTVVFSATSSSLGKFAIVGFKQEPLPTPIVTPIPPQEKPSSKTPISQTLTWLFFLGVFATACLYYLWYERKRTEHLVSATYIDKLKTKKHQTGVIYFDQEIAGNFATMQFLYATPLFSDQESQVYGPFSKGDVTTLPKEVAQILAEKRLAKQL